MLPPLTNRCRLPKRDPVFIRFHSHPLLAAWIVLVLLCAAPLKAQTLDQLATQIRTGGYVNDFAGVLSPSAKDQLTALCMEVDQKAQAQIAVVTIKSLNGASIDQYAPDLFAKVGIGNKSTNRGVLILFAIDDRKYRIEVGYGLEPILPDGKVGGFGREAVPYLRQGDYNGAIELMARRVADVIAADRGITLSGTPVAAPASEPENNGGRLTVNEIVLIIIFGWFIFSVIRGMTRRGGPASRINRGGGWWAGPIGGGWGGGGFGGGGGVGGFGGGMSGGGGASGGW